MSVGFGDPIDRTVGTSVPIGSGTTVSKDADTNRVRITTPSGGGSVDVQTSLVPMPQASFSIEYLADGIVQFANASLYGASFFWDFGDGSVSTARNPFHRYASAGSYTARLTVINSKGSSTIPTTVTIAAVVPAANFTSAVGGFTVYLNNTSTVAGDAVWDFGDGSYGSGDTATHTYSVNGNFTVTLSIGGYSKSTPITIDTEILLSWSDASSDETGFKIEHSLNGSDWTQIATVGAGIQSYGVTQAGDGVDSAVTNYFRVCAYNVFGDSPYTNTVTIQCGA